MMGFLVLAACAAGAEPSGYWRFEEGRAGEAAGAVASAVNGPALAGKAGAFEKGAPPAFDGAVPFKELWDGAAGQPAAIANSGSLRFSAPEVTGSGSPVGGEVVVSGAEALACPESFTLEAFVRVARLTPRHALIASKRRNGQTGASWSLSLTPAGALGVRFDTQPGAQTGGPGFNQIIGSPAVVSDGAWHHVALTYDAGTRAVGLFVDYVPSGRGTTLNQLVYDESDLVFGRGLDGWLDEVRLSAAALHPEQFLRPARFFSDMKPKAVILPPLLDQTPTRVQSALKPDLKRIGTLIPKSVGELETSQWSLGCETLDRDLANWDAYKGYLVPLGIRRIRLQGGWNRTEKKKGEYDFEWLDRIVDSAHELGLTVCLETSYNNRLYEPGGATGPGGLLPAGEETLAAWDRWVETLVRRYSAKGVNEWMMYNEPNLRKENTPALIVANNIRTAEIIRRVDPKAKIGAFVLAGLNVEMMRTMLTSIKEQGKLDLFQWAIYHGYSGNPDRLNERMAEFNALLAEIAPKIRPWQGEAGCASEEVQFALSGIDWTEYSHAKWNARRMLCDIGHGVESSVFTISDLGYHKDFISRYGLIKTNPDNSIIKVKSAFYTVQNVVTVFNDALERVPGYALAVEGGKTNLTWFAFRDKKSGLDVVALWDGAEIPSNHSEIETVRVTVKGGRFKEPVWLDLITGNLYEIPAEQMSVAGETVTFKDIPVYDGPAAIMDKSLLTFVPAREKKGAKKSAKAKPATKAAKADETRFARHLLPGTQQPAPAVLVLGRKEEATAGLVKWLNGQEAHAFVLETEGLSAEEVVKAAQGALETIRSRAAEWQVKAGAVGVLGVGAAGSWAARVEGADFAIVIDAGEAAAAAAPTAKGRLFVGKKDAWQAPLAKWLEQFKGKVF
jgi:hypothetical protein